MSSWREAVSANAQNELDALLDGALNLAEARLTDGELVPVALALDASGEGLLVAADPSALPSHPSGEDIRVQLCAQLIEGVARLRATAILTDVTLPGIGDAVRVELEHSEGACLAVLAPYTRSGGTVSYGELQATGTSPLIWPVR
jgi:hypothetical protein